MAPMTARQPLSPVPYDASKLAARIARHWDDDIVARLVEYVRVPAKSPHFDPEWRSPRRTTSSDRPWISWRSAQARAWRWS